MSERREELAIIKDVGVGIRDTNRAILWFTVHMLGCASLLVFEWGAAKTLLEEAYIHNVNELEGKACIVSSEGLSGATQFVRMY